LLIGCVVQNGLEHADEPEIFAHDANVLASDTETATNPGPGFTRVVVRFFYDDEKVV